MTKKNKKGRILGERANVKKNDNGNVFGPDDVARMPPGAERDELVRLFESFGLPVVIKDETPAKKTDNIIIRQSDSSVIPVGTSELDDVIEYQRRRQAEEGGSNELPWMTND